MVDFDEFEEVVSVFRCPQPIPVPGNGDLVMTEVEMPFIPGKELCARVIVWVWLENEGVDDGGKECEVMVYQNEYVRQTWSIWKTEPEGHLITLYVKDRDSIRIVATNGRKSGLVLSGIEITVFAKYEGD